MAAARLSNSSSSSSSRRGAVVAGRFFVRVGLFPARRAARGRGRHGEVDASEDWLCGCAPAMAEPGTMVFLPRFCEE